MANFQIQIPLPGLPIALYAISDASVVLTPTQEFKTIVDGSEASGGISAIFDQEGFTIGEESFNYGEKYYYKEIPELLQWLKQQHLEMPTFN